LRRAGVAADLRYSKGIHVRDMPAIPRRPRPREHFGELTAFFDRHLAKQVSVV
jgi:hypothetical protein